ncbi:hypothetical protein [Persicobacter sp. CCB-QB2]|uniref:hypothetical protein n=1 Tax=Persicobacter sp. CCB-QB2 TaxID=1561025 RepID=UPI0006A983F7|nr:hypothetical protein [Persicobacter sp. CCB-QB2]
MIKKSLLLFSLLLCSQFSQAQYGLSATYFIPKNGSFSNPVTPFSFRGLGQSWGLFGVETGFTLFRMAGMNIKETAIKTNESLTDPFFSLMIPVEAVFSLPTGIGLFQLKGGGFLYGNLDAKTHLGNFDRAYKKQNDWILANADLENKNGLGYGYRFGLSYLVEINPQVSLTLEGNYLSGQSEWAWKGTVEGVNASGDFIREAFSEANAQLDYSGYEISIGLVFQSANPKKKGKRRRRR